MTERMQKSVAMQKAAFERAKDGKSQLDEESLACSEAAKHLERLGAEIAYLARNAQANVEEYGDTEQAYLHMDEIERRAYRVINVLGTLDPEE